MENVILGRSGLSVSRLGFGSIPIQRVSEQEAIAVIERCLDLGITFLDSANAYSTSEERIGKAIRGRRQGLVLASKSNNRNAETLQEHLELCLKRYGSDYIDLYQVHNVRDFDTLSQVLEGKEVMGVLEEAKRKGKIKHIGISSHNMDVAIEAVKSDRFETLMFAFNCITSEPAEKLLPLCREHDVGFIAMKPLEGGMISNVTIAFKYLFQFPDIAVLVGTEHVHQVDQIVEVLSGPMDMTEEEQQEMQRLREELGTKFCRRCDYCQPCPEDIPISTMMEIRSFMNRLPLAGLFQGRIGTELEKSLGCTQCGECEARCPYQLPIRELMEEYANLYQELRKKYQETTAT